MARKYSCTGRNDPVRKSYRMSQLSFQGLSLAIGVLALACELRHDFCVAAGFATELFSLRGDAVAGWMGTFRRGVHRISFDRLWFHSRAVSYGFGVAAAVTCSGFSAAGVDELTAGAGLSAGSAVPAG